MSLSDTAPVTFTYREELTHDIITSRWQFPHRSRQLIGAPLGDIGVTAFASLSISEGDTILGDYTAKEHASKSYNLYHNVTHAEVDEAARAAVRQRTIKRFTATKPAWRPSPAPKPCSVWTTSAGQ